MALVGLGAPDRETPPLGTLTVAGVDPAVGAPAAVDLSQPLTVTAAGPVPADSATMTLQVLGVSVQTQSAPLLQGGGPAVATLPPLGGDFLVAGNLTGELALLHAGQVTQTWQFPVTTEQPATTTAVAAGVVGLFLFSIAYLESYLRSLRRGRRRISGSIGVPVSAGVLAVAVVGAVWVLAGREPTAAALATCVTLGVLAGVAGAIGASRVGRRRRYRRSLRGGGRPRRPTVRERSEI